MHSIKSTNEIDLFLRLNDNKTKLRKKFKKYCNMSTENLPINNCQIVPVVRFGTSEDFQKRTPQKGLNSALLGNELRPWVQHNRRKDTERERKILEGLLSLNPDTINNSDPNESILHNLAFRDLGSLTHEDLELFGFSTNKERQELLDIFAKMPNQDPNYDYICNSEAGRRFNNRIVSNTANHLMFLRSSISATNYKLKVLPPEDIVLGDKRYASRFALDALNSVKSISEELARDLDKLQYLARIAKQKKQKDRSPKERRLKILYYTAIAVGISCAWFWWWSKRSRSLNIENISKNLGQFQNIV